MPGTFQLLFIAWLFFDFSASLDSHGRTEASVLSSHPVSRAQSGGRVRRSALSGSRRALCRLLPETQAHFLTIDRGLPLKRQDGTYLMLPFKCVCVRVSDPEAQISDVSYWMIVFFFCVSFQCVCVNSLILFAFLILF